MADRPPFDQEEIEARRSVVVWASAMLSAEATFYEGAAQVLWLRQKIGGILDSDPDFDAFLAIHSETVHLPLRAQEPLWNKEALAKLLPEIQRIESWAAEFAPEACRRLIARFGHDTDNTPTHPGASDVG